MEVHAPFLIKCFACFQPQTLISSLDQTNKWVLEVKFQHIKEVLTSPRAMVFTQGVIHVVMATRAPDPRDWSTELMAVPSKGFLS